MASRRIIPLVALLMLMQLCTSLAVSSVELKDGQYQGIVVAISPIVPESSKDAIIDGIKKMFLDANEHLYVSTRKMTTFGQVTILVPTSWSSNAYPYEVASHQTWNDADVRVGPANPQYGDQPYTLQPGLCGEQGSYVHFTPDYFVNANSSATKYGDQGRVLVHEWAHYRYGVFDEYGFPGDTSYPAAYSDGQQLLPTACSDKSLQGELSEECSSDSTTSQQCKFRPDVNQMGVNSSIMSLHFLPNVSQFCDDKTHNIFAPTKQNALCNRRSAWNVVSSHADFSQKWAYAATYRTPTFRVVRPSDSRYVLLLDCSSNMNDFVINNSTSKTQRISFVRSAAVKFIQENLPDGTWLSLVSFGSRPEVLKPLAQLNAESRTGFANAIPRVTCGGNDRNIVTAIRKAIEQLDTRRINRTDGIILTVTNGVTDDASGYPQLKQELQQRNIRAVNIIYPPMPELTALPSLADATSGRNYMIAEVGAGQKGNSSTLAQLLGALDDVVTSQSGNPLQDKVIIYEQIHATNVDSILGSFTVDPSIGKNLKVTVSYYNRENIFGVSLQNPRQRFGSDEYADEEVTKTIVFRIKDDDAITGTWNYAIKANKHDDQPITVTVTSQPRQSYPITLRCWTNVGNTGLNASGTPLLIHAELFKGSRPVVNAKVKAILERPKVNNSYSFVEIDLFDNGNGAPDATKNDGVYSRYFTQFAELQGQFGMYSLTIYADDNDGRAKVVGDDQRWAWSAGSGILPKDPDTPFCCGSNAPVTLEEPTGPFQRYSIAPAILVTASPPVGLDVFPPNTVKDMKVERVDPISGQMTITWTAPGDDFDAGQVATYELRYLHDYQTLLNNFEFAGQVLDPIYPLPAGHQQRLVIYPPGGRDKNYFFALRAIDHAGQKSDISNVITCFVPPEPTTTTVAPPPTESSSISVVTTQPSTVARPLLTAELIGIIVGCTLAFLLVVAIIVAVICTRRRQRKLQEAKMTHHNVSQVHGPDVVRPLSMADEKDSQYIKSPASLSNVSITNGNHHDNNVFYTKTSSLSPRQFVPASEFLTHHDQHKMHSFSGVGGNGNGQLPGNGYHNNGNNHVQYYYEDDNDSINKSHYPQYAPMEVIVDRASISSKPSSYGSSQQTVEVTSSTGYGGGGGGPPIRDNGYVNSSYEDGGSENSAETARLRPDTINYMPIMAAPRRVMSESQV